MDRCAQEFQRALASFQQGQLIDADELCARILRLDPRHCDALHLAGLVALQAGHIPRSIELIRQSLAVRADQSFAHLNLAHALLRAGKPQAALVSCDTALAQRPHYPEALNCRGNALLQLRRPAEALAAYDEALRLQPELALLHSNRGNALRDLRRPGDALESYQRALQLLPGLREALLGSAEMLRLLGRLPEARGHCEECLGKDHDDVEALHLRARISQDLRLPAEALADIDHALALRPDAADLVIDRGNALCQLKRTDEALAAYRCAQQLAPANAEVALNEGHALLILERREEALASYERAIALKPDYAKGHYYRAQVLRQMRRLEDALVASATALALDPSYVAAVIGKGHALYELNRPAEAVAAYEQALRMEPDSIEALGARARVLVDAGQPEEATRSLERILATAPETGAEFTHTLGMLLNARLTACDWRDYASLTATLQAGVTDGERLMAPSLYTASALSPQAHLRCARNFAELKWGAIRAQSLPASGYGHERIRLAYVSADFREHAVSMLMASVFERHDRTRFEPIAIATRAPDESALARRVRGAFERFIDVTRRQDSEVAALLRELEIDICVDLTGYTTNLRSGIFARRAAPVQVNYLGYPGTLGASFMDYIVADGVVIPPGEEACYCEKIARLPYCYLPPGDRRTVVGCGKTRADYGLPERGFIFCAFNNHHKITPPVFDVWMRLLRAVEGSVLWLVAASEAVMHNLTREAVSRGIAPERIVFAPRLPKLADHLARYRVADLYLDTVPYNAHTTASDALRCGLPVLTCRGSMFPGRVAASLLTALSMPELIADTLEDYAARALQLANDRELLGHLRTRLSEQRDTHLLFDAGSFCRQLEVAYTMMWQRAEQGEPPQGFAVAMEQVSPPAISAPRRHLGQGGFS